jgi:hypothetical protein
MVRCKFVCNSRAERRDYVGRDAEGNHQYWRVFDYQFSAVFDGSPENKAFFKYTPSGTLTVSTVTNDQFVVGAEYYLDLTPAVVAAN